MFGLVLAAWLFVWSAAAAYGTRREPWFGSLGRVNAAALLLLAALAFAASVPGLRPLDVAVWSRRSRLVAPGASPEGRWEAAAYLAYDAHGSGQAAPKRLATSETAGAGARSVARLALANPAETFRALARRPSSVTLKLLGGPPLSDARRRLVERRLRDGEDAQDFCPAGPAPCEVRAVGVNGRTALVLVFEASTDDRGRWFDFRGDRRVVDGRFASALHLRDLTDGGQGVEAALGAEKWVEAAARGANEEEVRVRVVRVGSSAVLLTPGSGD